MRVSYHGGHSGDYCCHASGTKRELLEAYLRAGYSDVALTEHLPSRVGHLYPEEEAVGEAELERRFHELMTGVRSQLHREFDAKFTELWIGFETEFYGARPVEYLRAMIERYRPEVVVASVHHVRDISIDFSKELYERAVKACGGLEELFCAYYDAQFELFTVLAEYSRQIPIVVGHMDLIKLFAPTSVETQPVLERIRRNIDLATGAGIVFEVNSRGLKKLGEPYPSLTILREIQERGGAITFGDDSHSPEDVGRNDESVRRYAAQIFTTAAKFRRTEEGYLVEVSSLSATLAAGPA